MSALLLSKGVMKMCKCVFDTRTHKKGCHALTDKICEKIECPFYKSANKYKLVEGGYVEKRGNK